MSLNILPRSTWTTTAPGFPRYPSRRLVASQVAALVLHYPAMGAAVGALSQAAEAGWWRGFRNYHVGTRGWADIGYNYGVTQAGRVYTLAGDTHAAAHAASTAYPLANHHTIGVVLLLGDDEEPSAAMVASVNALWAYLRSSRGYTAMTKVMGHQEVRGAFTRCPGPRVMAAIRAGRFRYSTPKPPTTPPPTKPTVPSGSGVYTVRSGDTLGGIAKAHQTSVKALVLLNGIADPDRIDVGQKLYTRWVVSRGQTLGVIAKRAGTTVSRLVSLNKINDPDRITVGQLIRLP